MDLFDDEEKEDIIDLLLVDLECGDIILGMGGVRKVCFVFLGCGKRGGVCVVYYYLDDIILLLVLVVYVKNKKIDLLFDEKKVMMKLIVVIKVVVRR